MEEGQSDEHLADSGVGGENARMAASLDGLRGAVEQEALADVKEQLGDLETAVGKIPSPDPPPKTTLQIQDQADVEDAWQKYLQYFLDPAANHGLGKDALHRFLKGLSTVVGGEFPTRVSDDVTVESEVSSPNDNRPDIVIQEPDEFFVCCELKLYSSEGKAQTHRYLNDDFIGDMRKERFPEHNQHYAYVRRPGHPEAKDNAFVNITWRQVREWLVPVLLTHQGRYPTRTIAQLTDFLDTIHQDMTEDDHIQTAQEKMELYFNHEDAIREAKRGLETVYEYELQNWRRRFVEDYLPSTWSDEWHTNPDRNGQIYHSNWRQDEGLTVDDATVEMHFVHLIRDQESFTDGKLTIQLRWPGGSPYRERFTELFTSDRFAEELDSILGKHDIDKAPGMGYRNPRLTGKVYSVVKSDLPESYYETLQQAAQEHMELEPVLNEILATAIEDVEAER